MLLFRLLIVVSVFLLAGCTRSNEGHHDDHQHDEKLRITAYNADLELFAEADPFVTGKEASVLAHFTHLHNFKPLAKGEITISLIVGSEGIRQRVDKPLKAGIFEFTLKPSVAGAAKLIFDVKSSDGTSQLVITNIRVFDNEHDAQQHASALAESDGNGVIFTKEQSWKLDFATSEIHRESFNQIIKVPAIVEPVQDAEITIVSKANGIVQFVGSELTPGRAVSTGQQLLAIDHGGLINGNLEVVYQQALTEYNKTKRDYERKKVLIAEQVVSARELSDAEAAYKSALANYTNIKASYVSGKQIVKSPVKGNVQQLLVKNGENVQAGQALLTLFSESDLLLKAELPLKYFDKLGSVVSANFRRLNSDRVYTLTELNGKMLSFGKNVEMNNPLIPLVFQVQNVPGLITGSMVEMFLILNHSEASLSVPVGALIEEMGSYFVFVQITPEFFEKRMVKTALSDGMRIVITEGLTPGERIVTKGAVYLKLAMAASGLDTHGHVH
jgi:membrane fusion protein, heavy metal efflux system